MNFSFILFRWWQYRMCHINSINWGSLTPSEASQPGLKYKWSTMMSRILNTHSHYLLPVERSGRILLLWRVIFAPHFKRSLPPPVDDPTFILAILLTHPLGISVDGDEFGPLVYITHRLDAALRHPLLLNMESIRRLRRCLWCLIIVM